MSTSQPSVDVLLSHASGLRALARGLLGDDDAVEDVLQDTWIAALESPPAGEPGGWLRSVTRHLALKRRRGETRRSSRERSVSRAEALEPTDDLVAQSEILQRVVTAVTELDEPYSRVVWMRYFQDLSPRAIAEQLDVPLATVDSRLHRARARLRERLDATAGGGRTRWASALAAATGWRQASPGGLAMEWKLLFIGVTSIALTWSGARWVSTAGEARSAPLSAEDDAPVALEAPELAQEPAVPGATAAAAGANADEGRAPVEVRPVAPLAPSRPASSYAYRIEGRVVGFNDLGVGGATVSFVPPGHPIGDLFSTDSDGRFVLTFEARTPRVEGRLWVDAQFSAHHPAPARHLVLEAGTTRVRAALAPTDGWLVLDVFESPRLASVLPSDGEQHTDFTWPTPLVYADEEEVIEFVDASIDVALGDVFEPVRYEEEVAPSAGRFSPDESTPTPERVHVHGTVYAADGTPASNAAVVLRHADSGLLWQTAVTDDEGAFTTRVPAGSFRLTAGGGRYGLAETTVELEGEDLGGERVWSPVLDRGLELRGTLTLADGEPAVGWFVELERRGPDGVSFDGTLVEDGHFALPNLEGGGRLHVVAPGAELASWVIERVEPGAEALELVEPESARAGLLQVNVVTADLPEKLSAEVWIHQLSSGRTTWLRWDDARNAHAQSLPAGDYRVTVGGAEHGYVDLGTATVLPAGEVALEARIPGRGHLAWPDLDTEHAYTLYRRGPTVSSLFGTFPLAVAPEAPLPAGDYELFVHGEDYAAPSLRFTVAPGAATELDLDPASRHELSVFAPALAEGATLELTVADEAGAVVHTQSLTAAGVRLHLPAGTYRVAARDGEGAELEGDVRLTATDVLELSAKPVTAGR